MAGLMLVKQCCLDELSVVLNNDLDQPYRFIVLIFSNL